MDNQQPVPSVQPGEPPTLRYLDPEQVRVFRSEDGRLRATIADELSILAPRFLRVQPLTDPDRYISIREADPNGKEAGLLRRWRSLAPESRELVGIELDRRYLYPTVRRILSVRNFWGLVQCVFETDRGVREVTLRDVHDNVIYLGEARVLLTDAEGNRYDIPDVAALDPDSRAQLARII
ncbi:MAG TPA: DUF1854 domain-containing protein [Armatimonadota bacterium]|nr:DUF1854 domain-containing protein [Armatimonadota bacterium]